MHRLCGWLRTFDKILGTAITAVSELAGAAVNIDRHHARWRRQRLLRHAFKNGFHVGIPGRLRAFGTAFVAGNLIFNRAGCRGTA